MAAVHMVSSDGAGANDSEEWLALVTDYARPLPAPPPDLPAESQSDGSSTDDESDVAPVPTHSPGRVGAAAVGDASASAPAPGSVPSDVACEANGSDSMQKDKSPVHGGGGGGGGDISTELPTRTRRESIPQRRRATPLFSIASPEGNACESTEPFLQPPEEPQLPSPTPRGVPEMPASSDGGSVRSSNSTTTVSVDSGSSHHSDDALAWRRGSSGMSHGSTLSSVDRHRRRASHDSAPSGAQMLEPTGPRHQRAQSLSLDNEHSEWRRMQLQQQFERTLNVESGVKVESAEECQEHHRDLQQTSQLPLYRSAGAVSRKTAGE